MMTVAEQAPKRAPLLPREPLRPTGNQTWEIALAAQHPALSDSQENPRRFEQQLIAAKGILAILLPEPPHLRGIPYPLNQAQLEVLHHAKTDILIAYLGNVYRTRQAELSRKFKLDPDRVEKAQERTTNELWPNWATALPHYVDTTWPLPSKQEKLGQMHIFKQLDHMLSPKPNSTAPQPQTRQLETKQLPPLQAAYLRRFSHS